MIQRAVESGSPRASHTRPPRVYVPPMRLMAVSGMEVATIAERFGNGLLFDMEAAVRSMPQSRRGEARVAFLRLLLFAVARPDDEACRSFIGVYRDGGRAANGFADVQMVSIVLSRFHGWLVERSDCRSTRPYRETRYAAALLEAMVDIRAGSPAFTARHLKVNKPTGVPTPTLGSLPWPELEGLDPGDREVRALAMVREAAAAWFTSCSELFEFGQGILSCEDPPDDLDEGSWRAVRQFLVGACARLTDRATRPIRRITALSAGHHDLLHRSTWLLAGLSERAAEKWFPSGDAIGRARLGALSLRCICASPDAARSLSVVIACATALNRAPIAALPRRPVTFRTRSAFALATTGFIASWKARAGKTVVACLIDARPLLGLAGDRAVAAWNLTATEFMDEDEDHAEGGALVSLHEHAYVLDAIERFDRMAEAARKIDAGCRASGRFLVYPSICETPSAQLWAVDKKGMRGIAPGILGRPGVTFPAIRATIATINHHLGRSVFSTAARLCNEPATAWKSYVAPNFDRTDTMIGFFGRVVQALILPGREAAASIGVDPDEAEATLHMAGVSGLAAALGLSRPVDALAASPEAQPSDEALADLHMILRSAEHARSEMPRDVWAVRCQPRYAASRAMIMALVDAGFGSRYEGIAVRLDTELAARTVVLPIDWLG